MIKKPLQLCLSWMNADVIVVLGKQMQAMQLQ